jgi:hypothetical protein
VAPLGDTELLFHHVRADPLSWPGLKWLVQQVHVRPAPEHHAAGPAPLVAPFYLFAHASPDLSLVHLLRDDLRARGALLRGTISFDDSLPPGPPPACQLVVVDERGRLLTKTPVHVPLASQPLRFEVDVPAGSKLLRLGAKTDGGEIHALVVVRAFTITPR